jgi:hypothetical protein
MMEGCLPLVCGSRAWYYRLSMPGPTAQNRGRGANESMRTVLVALGAELGVALAKAGAAAFTGSSALAAEASHSLADTANDLFLSSLSDAASALPMLGIHWGSDEKPTSGR